MPPLFNAVSSSARQLLLLLRCLPVSSSGKAHIRLSAEGLRVSSEEGVSLEAFVFIKRSLFASYSYNADQEEQSAFLVNHNALIETLNILTLADMPAPKQSATTEAYAAHRLNRHAGVNAFSSHAFGMNGICTFTYENENSSLSIHMADAGVTTTCDLTTYNATNMLDIPFARDAIAVKAVLPASLILDAITELSSLNPDHLTISALPNKSKNSGLSLSATGSLGSANVDFDANNTLAAEPLFEKFICSAKTTASFRFNQFRSATRAMATATKISLRLDEEGVLSMQFLVQLEGLGEVEDSTAFVDFSMVPLMEGEADVDSTTDNED